MSLLVDFDVSNFWDKSEYAVKTYTGPGLSDVLVASVETALGYRLPHSNVELMRTLNGGMPVNNRHRAPAPTTWAADHVAIDGIFGIHDVGHTSLGGKHGSQFWISEWKYPTIGVYFADCPSAGHDMVALDHSACGPHGEPQVVHVDQERDFAITVLAKTFEQFIRGLQPESAFEIQA